MSQELRNSIYGVVAAVGALLIVIGVISEDEWQVILTALGGIATTLTTVLAFMNSRTATSTTVPIPKDEVVSVNTTKHGTVGTEGEQLP